MQKCNLECNWCNDDWDVIGIEIMKKMIWIWWRKKFLEMQVTKIKLKKGKNGKYGLLWSCHAKNHARKMIPFIFVPTLTFSIKKMTLLTF
jgi:hypothetical protein